MSPPNDEAAAHAGSKPDWQRRRDTHAAAFPENLRNWLLLNPWWSGHAAAVVAAAEALRADAPPSAGFPIIHVLSPQELRGDWIAGEPVVLRDLDPAYDWLLLWREADRLTAMTIEDDGAFDRVFWDKDLGGAFAAVLLGALRPKSGTTKHLPNRSS